MTLFGKYQKAITALVSGGIGWGAVVISSPSGPITASEWLGLAVVVAVALGVYAVPNTPPAPTPAEGLIAALEELLKRTATAPTAPGAAPVAPVAPEAPAAPVMAATATLPPLVAPPAPGG